MMLYMMTMHDQRHARSGGGGGGGGTIRGINNNHRNGCTKMLLQLFHVLWCLLLLRVLVDDVVPTMNAVVVAFRSSTTTTTTRSHTTLMNQQQHQQQQQQLHNCYITSKLLAQSSSQQEKDSNRQQRPSFPLLPNLFQRPTPPSNNNNNNNNNSINEKQQQQQQFTSSYRYDDTSDEGLIQHAKYIIQQTDCGLLDPSILSSTSSNDNNDNDATTTTTTTVPQFKFISSQLNVPLSKTEYITAGRYFNLRNAFPDYNYRPYDFRIIDSDSDTDNSNSNNNIVTVRCTCRCTGTMRGELRLRNNILLAPTGITMICPPEAMTISFHRTTGIVTKVCTGFVLDRFVGNTRGTCGVPAASIIAGNDDETDISIWDLVPPMTIVRNIFARPIKQQQKGKGNDENQFLSPFPESVMIQLTKGILSSQMAYKDSTLLSDDTFTYYTPTVGPVNKQDFLRTFAQQEFPNTPTIKIQPLFSNFRVDPYDPIRVWVDVVPTTSNDGFIGPPYAMSFTFDDNGYCTRITSQAVIDPSVGTSAGGLSGYEGYLYSIGQASPGIFTRPISRSLERLRIRMISPITGLNVDEYQLPQPRSTNPFELVSKWITTKPQQPLVTSKRQLQSPTPPQIESSEVVKRLESLKNFASSIRIVPPSVSDNDTSRSSSTTKTTTVQQRLAQAAKATQQSKLMIEQAKREAAALQQKIVQAEANAVRQQKQQAEILEKQQRDKQQLAVKAAAAATAEQQQKKKKLVAELAARQKQQQVATTAAFQQQLEQKKTQQLEQRKKKAAAADAAQQKAADDAQQKRQEREQAEKARQLALEKQRKDQEEMERQKRASAAAEVVIRQREVEAQRIAETAAQEAKKVQQMKEQLAATDERTRRSGSASTAFKAKAAAERLAAMSNSKQKSSSVPIQRSSTTSRSVYGVTTGSSSADSMSGNSVPILPALARATISLFGLGKSELDELPTGKSSKSLSTTISKSRPVVAATRIKAAPMGVPTVTRWRQNSDQTITGLVKGSRNFDNGSRITTSPITTGVVASGQVVRTGSGSRYFLE